MPRRFRLLYLKKRGHRRTGSRAWGSVGEAVFFGFFALVGVFFFFVLLFTLVIPEGRAHFEFLEHRCKVLDKHIVEEEADSGTQYCPEIQIEYEVQGTHYQQWAYTINKTALLHKEEVQAILDRFSVGKEATCWYDPMDPNRVVLINGLSWWRYLLLFIPAVFIIVGAGGLVLTALNWGKSVEQRSILVQKVIPAGVMGTGDKYKKQVPLYPTVPARADITSSPGTRLQYRLPIEQSPGWSLFGLFVIGLLWNGIVVWFIIDSFRTGRAYWLIFLIYSPFVAIGIGFFNWFFRKFLVATGIGPTLLEISDHPLHPGEEYAIFISQAGRLTVNALTLSLVCEEESRYQQGTHSRTEKREVRRQTILRRENFEIPAGAPFEAECSFTLPPEAMHSFQAGHNRIHWYFIVEGDVLGWPVYKRAFPIIVRPKDGSDKK